MKYTYKLNEFQAMLSPLFNKNKETREEKLPDFFEDLANYFLTKGYFLINDERKIYICDVEFYYHEEFEGGIKDWIMYHRNYYPNNKSDILGYLEVGQLNSHPSGIDITFEHEDKTNAGKSYRAGMLIRGFKIVPSINDTYPPLFNYHPKESYDDRSTHFYDALLNCGNVHYGVSFKWVEEKRNCKMEQDSIFRHNVAEYGKNTTNGVVEKIEYDSEGYENKYEGVGLNNINQKCKGTKDKQCMRPWRYKLESVSI